MEAAKFGSLESMSPVSREAAEAYEQAGPALLERVNPRMVAHLKLSRLIGDAPVTTMFDNHRNHHLFLSNVYRFGAFRMLAKIIPWVYRAYRARGFAADYFPMALNEWRVAINEVLPADLASQLTPLYDWMLQHHEVFAGAASGPLVVSQASPELETQRLEFLSALLAGDSGRATRMALAYRDSSDGLMQFYLHVVQPCLYEIGTMWEEGRVSVAEEHLASALVARALSAQYVTLNIPESTRGRAVVTAASNEFHEIGAWMVANCLELDGWQVTYLGANTPHADLLGLLLKSPPRILAVSVGMPFNLTGAAELIDRVRHQPGLQQTRIMVGGLAFHHFPELVETIGADAFGTDGVHAVQIAAQWAKDLAT